MKITEFVKEKTKDISEFSIKENQAKQSEEQKKIDDNFAASIVYVYKLFKEIQFASNESSFVMSQANFDKAGQIIVKCKDATKKNAVTTADINSINTVAKELASNLGDEWSAYFIAETSSVKEVLSISKNIASINVTELISKIDKASQWNENAETIKEMVLAIKRAQQLIDQMQLKPANVEFLKKVISKTATLDDISDEVLNWLKNEQLTGKVKISF